MNVFKTKDRSLNHAELKQPRRNMPTKLRLAIGCLSVVASTACLESPPQQWVGPEFGLTVGIEGDSLTHSSHRGQGSEAQGTAFTDQLTQLGYRSGVAATIGATSEDLAGRRSWPLPGADILVIALGTNDGRMNAEGEPSVELNHYQSNIEEYVESQDPDCLVTVGVREELSWGLDITGPGINQRLQQIALSRDGIFVDWNRLSDEAGEGVIGPDGIHWDWTLTSTPDAKGAVAYRSAIIDGVNECAEKIS